MSNSTADTERDVTTIAGFGTLDEMDGPGYVRQALANQTRTRNDANDRTEGSHDVVTWTALGAGTRQVIGMVYYSHVTNDADSIPLFYVDEGGFPFAANGADVTYTPNVAGAYQLIAP